MRHKCMHFEDFVELLIILNVIFIYKNLEKYKIEIGAELCSNNIQI